MKRKEMSATRNGSGFSNEPYMNRRQVLQKHTEELLLQHTEEQIDDLEQTVGSLKAVSKLMNEEILKSNRLLDELSTGVDNTGGLLQAAQNQLRRIAESGANRLMCYVVLFVVVMFLLVYFAITWFTRKSVQ